MRTIAIVVLYNDDTQTAEDNILKIARQVEKVLLIDNSDTSYASRFTHLQRVVYLPQLRNIGIAAAQNVGISIAIEEGFDFIFFADPDSEIPSNTVDCLQEKFLEIQKFDPNIGGVGATAFNLQTNSFISFDKDTIREYPGFGATQLTYLMNSSSFIAVPLFQKVGLMWEELFIDGVDSEWCWRATHVAHAHFYQDKNVVIEHQLGNTGRKVGGKIRSIGSPKRLYYQYRNYFLLLKKHYVPRKWLWVNGWKYLFKAFYYPLCVPPRGMNLKYICQGIFNGIKTTL